MDSRKKVKKPITEKSNPTIEDRVKSTLETEKEKLNVNFSKFQLKPICLQGRFNNHFKDDQHFCSIATAFLGKILPKLTSHSFNEVREGGQEAKGIHFHTIEDQHRSLVREVLEKYNFSAITINQMFEGNKIFDFSASLGHIYAARMVCHKVDNILYLLFLDTNHHIYINEKYVRESLFYEDCPQYISGECKYMPEDCFAVSYLDEKKIQESLGFAYTPPKLDP